MLTFKQLEALYWVGRLGGFAQAAHKLHTTQSAISKRVRELELQFDTQFFDRSQRNARLTERGEQMFELAGSLLEQRDVTVERMAQAQAATPRLRLGVTELCAMTWLPAWVAQVRAQHPHLVVEPEVDLSNRLRDRLQADEIDLVVAPTLFDEEGVAGLTRTPLAQVALSWMCRPGLVPPGKALRLSQLSTQRLLIQGDTAGTGLFYKRWLGSMGVKAGNPIVCNSLAGRIAMTKAGLGISYLPRQCLQPVLDAGGLALVKISPALPPTAYVCLHKRGRRGTLMSSVAKLAAQCCDFTRLA